MNMIYPRNDERHTETARPSVRLPKAEPNFDGWGPRLRF